LPGIFKGFVKVKTFYVKNLTSKLCFARIMRSVDLFLVSYAQGDSLFSDDDRAGLEQHNCDDEKWLLAKSEFSLFINSESFACIETMKTAKRLGKNVDKGELH